MKTYSPYLAVDLLVTKLGATGLSNSSNFQPAIERKLCRILPRRAEECGHRRGQEDNKPNPQGIKSRVDKPKTCMQIRMRSCWNSFRVLEIRIYAGEFLDENMESVMCTRCVPGDRVEYDNTRRKKLLQISTSGEPAAFLHCCRVAIDCR